MSKQPKPRKWRNIHASHPIMRKGGVHEKSNGAKRRAAKDDTRRSIDEALSGASQANFSTQLLPIFSTSHNQLPEIRHLLIVELLQHG